MPKPGKPAPDFTLTNQHHEPVTLSDLQGRKVVLFTFISAGASACTTQAQAFLKAFPTLEKAGVLVFGIGVDGPDVLSAWHSELGLPFDLLADPDHEVLSLYDAWDGLSFKARSFAAPLRSFWVIDEGGILQAGQARVTVEMCMNGVLTALSL